jgi:peptidoglycan hydrolase CwlO-like protein
MKSAIPVQDQIVELNKKLQLHEGDKKAYIEASNATINQNNENIAALRHENKALHKKLADVINGDDKVIDKALGDRKIEKQALRNKPGREAVQIIDQKVSFLSKMPPDSRGAHNWYTRQF